MQTAAGQRRGGVTRAGALAPCVHASAKARCGTRTLAPRLSRPRAAQGGVSRPQRSGDPRVDRRFGLARPGPGGPQTRPAGLPRPQDAPSDGPRRVASGAHRGDLAMSSGRPGPKRAPRPQTGPGGARRPRRAPQGARGGPRDAPERRGSRRVRRGPRAARRRPRCCCGRLPLLLRACGELRPLLLGPGGERRRGVAARPQAHALPCANGAAPAGPATRRERPCGPAMPLAAPAGRGSASAAKKAAKTRRAGVDPGTPGMTVNTDLPTELLRERC